jgi:hypothetical protein
MIPLYTGMDELIFINQHFSRTPAALHSTLIFRSKLLHQATAILLHLFMIYFTMLSVPQTIRAG